MFLLITNMETCVYQEQHFASSDVSARTKNHYLHHFDMRVKARGGFMSNAATIIWSLEIVFE